jgi:hypothetical protein
VPAGTSRSTKAGQHAFRPLGFQNLPDYTTKS